MTQQFTDEDPDLGAWETRQAIAEEQERVRGFLGGRVTAQSILLDLSKGRIGPSLAYSRLIALPGMTGDQARLLLNTMSGQEDPRMPPSPPGWVDRSDFDMSSLTNFNEVVAAIRNGDIGPIEGLNHWVSLGGDWTQSLLALRNLFPDSTELGGGGVPEGYGADPDILAQQQRAMADPWASGDPLGREALPFFESAEAAARLAQEKLSQSFGGRYEAFNQFLAGSPEAQFITPFARGALGSKFGPLSAQYTLGEIGRVPGMATAGTTPRATVPIGTSILADPQPIGTFRDFLGTNPVGFGPESFANAFQQLAPLYAPGAELTRQQSLARTRLGEEETAENLIKQAYASQLSPFFRDLAGAQMDRRFAAFRGEDPTTDLFQEFVNRKFNF
jgi:hypothetical protein